MEKRIEQIEKDVKDIRDNHLHDLRDDIGLVRKDVAVLQALFNEHRRLSWLILTATLGVLGKVLFF